MNVLSAVIFLLAVYRIEQTVQNAYTNIFPMGTHGSHWKPLFGNWIKLLDTFECVVEPTAPSNLDKITSALNWCSFIYYRVTRTA